MARFAPGQVWLSVLKTTFPFLNSITCPVDWESTTDTQFSVAVIAAPA